MDENETILGYHGQCYCGKVKFLVRNDAYPTKAVYCHCESCRRAHAAPLYHVVYIPPSFSPLLREKI